MRKICTKCKEEKDVSEFYVSRIGKNNIPVYRTDCKKCKCSKQNAVSIKRLGSPKKYNITSDVKDFIKDIERRSGYVDIIDCYKLISYGVDIYGYIIDPKASVKMELELYYNKLLYDIENENYKIKKVKGAKYCCKCGDIIIKGSSYCRVCRREYNENYKANKANKQI